MWEDIEKGVAEGRAAWGENGLAGWRGAGRKLHITKE